MRDWPSVQCGNFIEPHTKMTHLQVTLNVLESRYDSVATLPYVDRLKTHVNHDLFPDLCYRMLAELHSGAKRSVTLIMRMKGHVFSSTGS